MSIPFTCVCGKAMKAKDNFAGRKIKCPGCGQVVRIPETEKIADAPAMFRPVAQETAKPVLAQRSANPAARPLHTWVDQSLIQQPTPWLPGDENHYQKGIKELRAGMSGLAKSGLVLLVLGGMITVGWMLFLNR